LVLGAPWQKSARIQAFFSPPSEILQIFAFYCIFEHQFLDSCKIKFFFSLLKTCAFWQKVWRILLEKGENQKFFKTLLGNLGFGGSVAKKCQNSSIFLTPLRIFANFQVLLQF